MNKLKVMQLRERWNHSSAPIRQAQGKPSLALPERQTATRLRKRRRCVAGFSRSYCGGGGNC